MDGFAVRPRKARQQRKDTTTAKELQPHQQRVVEERAELEDKLGKLQAFITGERFAAESDAEQGRLVFAT